MLSEKLRRRLHLGDLNWEGREEELREKKAPPAFQGRTRCPLPSTLFPARKGVGAAADSVGGGPIPIRSHRSFPPWGFTEIKPTRTQPFPAFCLITSNWIKIRENIQLLKAPIKRRGGLPTNSPHPHTQLESPPSSGQTWPNSRSSSVCLRSLIAWGPQPFLPITALSVLYLKSLLFPLSGPRRLSIWYLRKRCVCVFGGGGHPALQSASWSC